MREPWLIPALARGSHLDVELLRRIHGVPGAVPMDEYPRRAGKAVRRYLDILRRSSLLAHWVAMTSPDVRNPDTGAALDFPVLPLEVLSQDLREAVQTFSLRRGRQAVDELVTRIYGLTKADVTLVSDNFPDVRHMKLLGPTSAGPPIWRFALWLEELLRPVFGRTETTLRCAPFDEQAFEGWQVLELRSTPSGLSRRPPARLAQAIVEHWPRDFFIERLEHGRLVIVVRSEIRQATYTTARLIAIEVLNEHAQHLHPRP